MAGKNLSYPWTEPVVQGLLKQPHLGFVVTDSRGVVAQANELFASLFGLERRALIDRQLDEALAQAIPGYQSPLSQTLASGQSTSVEGSIVRLSGVEFHVAVTSWPLFTGDGRLMGACAIACDVTESRRLMANWRAAERALTHLRDEMYIVDAGRRIIWTNRGEDLIGVDFLQRFCRGRKLNEDGTYASRIIEVLETGRDYVDQVMTSADGTRATRINIRRLVDEAGEVIGCVSLAFDVTEEARLKEQVRRSERLGMIGELASTTAHELRNPLTAMRATAQLGLLANDLNETKEYFELIINEIDKLNQFIGELVMLSKPGVEPLIPIDVNDLCEQVLALVHGKVLIGNVRVQTELASGLPPMLASRRLMKQALLNVLTNAIQAMPDGGALTVRTRFDESAGRCEISIRDSGVGMSRETLEKLFQPFFTTKDTGTGLGLAVTHQIVVDAHRGSIEFDSVIGEGTVVKIAIPVAESAKEAAAGSMPQ